MFDFISGAVTFKFVIVVFETRLKILKTIFQIGYEIKQAEYYNNSIQMPR